MPLQCSQMKGARRRLDGSSSGSRRLELCLVEREEVGASKVFEKFLQILSTENSSQCKNMFGKTIGVPKTASAGERPVSSLGCTQSPRSTLGNPWPKLPRWHRHEAHPWGGNGVSRLCFEISGRKLIQLWATFSNFFFYITVQTSYIYILTDV